MVFAGPGSTGPYSSVGTALLADQKTTNDATANLSLGVTDPTGGGVFLYSKAQAKALGLSVASGSDGTFTFGNGFSYTFDPNNRAVAGSFDFIGVAEHEISKSWGASVY